MTTYQAKFFGASVSSINSNIGWGSNPSILDLTLVEDTSDGDMFSPLPAGYPAYFSYGSFNFGGLVQKVTTSHNPEKIYNVSLIDPRGILTGTKIILSSYSGATITNIYNIFGYYENLLGFGGADSNDTGMPWTKIRDGLIELVNQTPINYLGNYYKLSIDSLPTNLSAYYRVNASNGIISIADFISNIAEACSADYLITMRLINNINTIVVSFIDRSRQPSLGAISRFIAVVSGAKSKEYGYEFRDEPTSKFLTGGQVQLLYHQPGTSYATYSNLGDDIISIDDSECSPKISDFVANDARIFTSKFKNTDDFKSLEIFDYYGLDKNSNIIFPEIATFPLYAWKGISELNGVTFPVVLFTPFDNEPPQVFNNNPWILLGRVYVTQEIIKLNAIGVDVIGVLDEYYTTQKELLAVLAGRDQWESFLAVYEYAPSVHNSRAAAFCRDGDIGKEREAMIAGNTNINHPITQMTPAKIANLSSREVNGERVALNRDAQSNADILYGFLHSFASEYIGKKFIVKMPDVQFKRDADTDLISTNYNPTDGGFVDEDEYQSLSSNLMLPVDIEKFKTQDGKVQGYVRYKILGNQTLQETILNESFIKHLVINKAGGLINNNYDLDISSFDRSEYDVVEIPNSKSKTKKSGKKYEQYAYIKCQVEPDFVFEDISNGTGPRAIITLSSRVIRVSDNIENICDNIALIGETWKLLGLNQVDVDRLDTLLGQMQNMLNSQEYADYIAPYHIIPEAAMVPIRSNVTRYGPWYSQGGYGAVEVEIDDTLVPWHFGSYELLNTNASAKIDFGASSLQTSEDGSVEFPDIPNRSLGQELISDGPYINGITISMSTQGVTTQYRLETWTPKYGKALKQQIDKVNKIEGLLANKKRDIAELRRIIDRKILSTSSNHQKDLIKNLMSKPRRHKNNSSMSVVTGRVITDEDQNKTVVNLNPFYNVRQEIPSDNAEYVRHSFMTLDGLFRPYSTSTSASGILPFFETPSANETITVSQLNPFGSGNDISAYSQKEEYTDMDFTIDNEDTKRGMGLKAPVVLVGYGYDINGKPVPNENPSSPTDVFISGYRSRQELWKAGPLDARWDDSRKVWAAVGNSVFRGKLREALTYRTSVGALAEFYNPGRYPGLGPYMSGDYVSSTGVVYDWLLSSGDSIVAGTNVFVSNIGGRNYVISAACGVD